MRVGQSQHARTLRCNVLAPDLREAEEETLLRSEAVDLLFRLALKALFHRHEREAGTAVVSRVLAQSQFAVKVHALDRRELGVLVGETAGALFKLRLVLGRPPVGEVAIGCELRA